MHKIIDWRFILTPFTITYWDLKSVRRKYYYIFGLKVADVALNPKDY